MDALGARCLVLSVGICGCSGRRPAILPFISQPRKAPAADIPSDWCHKSLTPVAQPCIVMVL